MFCGITHLKEKITAKGYHWFYKTTPFLCFEGKKTESNSSIFFWYSPLFGMRQKQPKNQWNCLVLNFNQIKASLFQYKFKSIFPQKHVIAFTFNHKSFLFISFMSNRKYSYIFSPVLSSGNISSQSLTGLYNVIINCYKSANKYLKLHCYHREHAYMYMYITQS